MNFKEALIAHLQGEKVECRDGPGYSWQLFARYFGGTTLADLEKGPFDCFQLRLAPRTIFVNGVEVPAGEDKKPKYLTKFYFPDFEDDDLYGEGDWDGAKLDFAMLERGLVYLNKDDAIARAKAMLLTSDKQQERTFAWDAGKIAEKQCDSLQSGVERWVS